MKKRFDTVYLQISSVTHAYRGQRILQRNGIPSLVQRDSRFASPAARPGSGKGPGDPSAGRNPGAWREGRGWK